MGKFLVSTLVFTMLLSCQSILANYKTLQTGDILLLDMDCWSCALIEDETGGPYSHSGIVLNINGKIQIGQSLGQVYLLDFDYFKNFTTKPIMHLRPKSMSRYKKEKLLSLYFNDYDGLPFDDDFVWDDEKLYCSEFIYKILDDVISFKSFGPKPMSYTRNWEAWKAYFKKEPPQGKIGISPNDFTRSPEFEFVQYLSM
jgi:hypothetical protein